MIKKLFGPLLILIAISVFLNTYQKENIPACINADEAAFGYNSFSIAKTAKDEYGTYLPFRLKSFGDYKMPLYSYLSAPIIGTLGLNDTTTRALNTIFAALLPISMFLLLKELFAKKTVAITGALLVATSLGLHMVGRQAHEAYPTTTLITLAFFFFLRSIKTHKPKDIIPFLILLFFSLVGYQSTRIFALYFFVVTIFLLVKKKVAWGITIGLLVVIGIFAYTDILIQPERVKNLLFFNSEGFNSKVHELRIEGGSRLFYNKMTVGAQEVFTDYLRYFSPEFLVFEGDPNKRFGFPGMGVLTILEYFGLFVGSYYLIRKRHPARYYLFSLLAIAPITGALTKVDTSLTRSFFMLIPLLGIVAYGLVQIITALPKKQVVGGIFILGVIQGLLLFYHWDFYLNHYPKRAVVIRDWQCGYKELAQYIEKNYSSYDRFYITKRHGQPYIFLLYYLQYPPGIYHNQARLSAPDEQGFGQVESFDKFTFEFPEKPSPNSVIIGYPDEFSNSKNLNMGTNSVTKIKIGTEEIFWIYENPSSK